MDTKIIRFKDEQDKATQMLTTLKDSLSQLLFPFMQPIIDGLQQLETQIKVLCAISESNSNLLSIQNDMDLVKKTITTLTPANTQGIIDAINKLPQSIDITADGQVTLDLNKYDNSLKTVISNVAKINTLNTNLSNLEKELIETRTLVNENKTTISNLSNKIDTQITSLVNNYQANINKITPIEKKIDLFLLVYQTNFIIDDYLGLGTKTPYLQIDTVKEDVTRITLFSNYTDEQIGKRAYGVLITLYKEFQSRHQLDVYDNLTEMWKDKGWWSIK